jgi:hypothetical protein
MEGPHRNTLKLEEKIRSLIDEIFDQHPAPDALLILIGLFTFSMATHLPPEWDKHSRKNYRNASRHSRGARHCQRAARNRLSARALIAQSPSIRSGKR